MFVAHMSLLLGEFINSYDLLLLCMDIVNRCLYDKKSSFICFQCALGLTVSVRDGTYFQGQ